MEKITLWKDRDNRKIDPVLFSEIAERLAIELAGDAGRRTNQISQIRKFYDEVVRLNMEVKNSHANNWDNILPLVNMLIAKTAYANGRKKLVSDSFLSFIRSSVEQVKEPEDLEVFANLFEAFYGFYKLHCPEK
ncbi:MAG: type III-A CRISPR-associated protein Csm2 [Dissulfuribacterales bacterium]